METRDRSRGGGDKKKKVMFVHTNYSLPYFGPFHSGQDNTTSIIVQGKPIRLLD